jgi:hypothetical protein
MWIHSCRLLRGNLFAIGYFFVFPLFSNHLDAAETVAELEPFLKTYCVNCHGEEKQKGDHRFDALTLNLSDSNNLRSWQNILDVLHLGEMPPDKKDVKQPSEQERRQVIASLEEQLLKAHAQNNSTGGQTVYRRLNRFEYRNTLRDLLGINIDFVDPTEKFLPDASKEGLDNIGNVLVTSDYFLQQAMGTAETMIQRATHFEPRPKTISRISPGPVLHRKGGILTTASREINAYDEIFEQAGRSFNEGYIGMSDYPKGVAVSGRYRIQLTTSSSNQRHPWGDMIPTNQNEALRVGVVIFNAGTSDALRYDASERMVGEYPLPESGAKRTVELELWLEEGWAPKFKWVNAPFRAYRTGEKLLQRYLPDLHQPRPDPRLGTKVKQAYLYKMGRLLVENNKGPTLRIHQVKIDGPLLDQWPPKGHVLMYGKGEVRSQDIEIHLKRFATQAFRRSVTTYEMKPYAALVRRYETEGKSTVEALQIGYKAVMASTPFLHMPQFNDTLSANELATRLSYFLWSSMPDDTLFDLAKNGRLLQPDVLHAQVERMLDDLKSQDFATHFTERWLRLDKINSMPPDLRRYKSYYDENLDVAMKQETQLFFAHILKNNLPISNFIDSDFTFVNRGLAALYGMAALDDAALVKVAITDKRRGGLLGHASVLTATANGIDTSPVIRGVWVLENLLGTPPTPPPPDVEPLAPDLRGALTIREQLDKHRENPSCYDCHVKIDPMGFALENYGPIGEWRESYGRSKISIDASAQMADGTHYKDIIQFKEELLKRKDLVTRHLTKKLLEYSTGRIMELKDRQELESTFVAVKAKGSGLRDLVHAVVQSKVFLKK